MYKWRLLLLASLAVFQPIASFTERKLVDGRQECCDRQPYTFQRDTRLAVYGISRLNKLVSDERRVNYRQEVPKSIRNVDFDINIASRHHTVSRGRDNRRITSHLNDRFSRAERSYTRETIPDKRDRQISYERIIGNTPGNDRDNLIYRKTVRDYDDNTRSRTVVSRRIRDSSSDRSQTIKGTTEIRNMFQQTRDEIVRSDSTNARNEPRTSRDIIERRSLLSRFESRLRINNNNMMDRRSLERKTRDVGDVDETNRRSSSLSRLLDSTRRSNMDPRIVNLNTRSDRRFVRNILDHDRLDSRLSNNGNMHRNLRSYLDQNARSVEDRKANVHTSRINNSAKEIREIKENREVENYRKRDERRYSRQRERQTRVNMADAEFRLLSRHSERLNSKQNIPYSSRAVLAEVRETILEAKSRFDVNNERRFLYQRGRVIHNRQSTDSNVGPRDYDSSYIMNENRNIQQNNQRVREQTNTVGRLTRSLDRNFRQINERRESRESRDEAENRVRSRIISQNLRYTEKQERDINERTRSLQFDESRHISNERRSLNVNNKRVNVERDHAQSRFESRQQRQRNDKSYKERQSNNIDENVRLSTVNNRARSLIEPRKNLRNEARFERQSLHLVRSMSQDIERPQRDVERRVSRAGLRARYETRDRSMRLVDTRDSYIRMQKTTPQRLSDTSRNIENSIRNIVYGDREPTIEARFVESAKYRGDLMSLIRNKSEPDYQAPVLSWQYLFYTLQGIYLCTIIMQMVFEDKSGAKKVSFWNSALKVPVKVD